VVKSPPKGAIGGKRRRPPGAYQALPGGQNRTKRPYSGCRPGRRHQLPGFGSEPAYRVLPLSPSHGSSPQRSFKWAPVKAADRRYVLIHFRGKYHVAHKRVSRSNSAAGRHAVHPISGRAAVGDRFRPRRRTGPDGAARRSVRASLAGRGGQDRRAMRGSQARDRMRPRRPTRPWGARGARGKREAWRTVNAAFRKAI
jgi:hypothetical protein